MKDPTKLEVLESLMTTEMHPAITMSYLYEKELLSMFANASHRSRGLFLNHVNNRSPPIRCFGQFFIWTKGSPAVARGLSFLDTQQQERNTCASDHYCTSHVKRMGVGTQGVSHKTCETK